MEKPLGKLRTIGLIAVCLIVGFAAGCFFSPSLKMTLFLSPSSSESSSGSSSVSALPPESSAPSSSSSSSRPSSSSVSSSQASSSPEVSLPEELPPVESGPPPFSEREIERRMAFYTPENDVQHLNAASLRIAEALRRGDLSTTFWAQELPVGKEGEFLSDAFHAAVLQDPMICILPSGASGESDGNSFSYRYVYYGSPARAAEMMEELDTAARRILAHIIREDMTPQEKSDAICRYLTENVAYNYEVADKIDAGLRSAEIALSQTAYSSLVQKRSVCTGTSLAYVLLARRAGLDAICVSGSLVDGGRHVWNRVYLDGEWQTVDITMLQVGRTLSDNDRIEDDLYRNDY